MKPLIIAILLMITDPLQLAKINGLKKEANEAYQNGNYELAAQKYSMLRDSLNVAEDEIALNLAHSYFQLGDTSHAKTNYSSLTASSNSELKSIATQQLGVMAKNENKLEESLSYLKESIRANPKNRDAKYDYEVVKKLLDQQKENQQNQDQQNQDQKDQQNQDQQNQDQQNQDQQNQDQKDQQQKDQENQDQNEQKKDSEQKDGEQSEDQQQQEGEKSDEEKQQEMDEATRQKLEEMNMSEEKAKMILEALKNNEIQYIQQRKRQPTQQQNSDRPDW